MQIVVTNLGDAKLVTASGRIDAEVAAEFEERLGAFIQGGTKTLILNFSGVDYLSSAGLRVVLSTGKSLQGASGKLVLVVPPGPVRQIVEAVGFHKMFPVCSNMDEAGKHTTGNFMIHAGKEWGVDILTVFGRVDAERSPELEAAGRQILEPGHIKLVINLGAVQYLSSAGLCALLNLAKLAKARSCRLFLCTPTPPVLQILKLSGFDKLFPILDSKDKALVA